MKNSVVFWKGSGVYCGFKKSNTSIFGRACAPQKRDGKVRNGALLATLMMTAAATLGTPQAAQAVVMPGDVTIVRVNSNTDGFSIVALRDLTADEVIFATDNGITSAGAFRTGEGAGSVDILTANLAKGAVLEVPGTPAAVGANFALSIALHSL